jgi:hypothetical protein
MWHRSHRYNRREATQVVNLVNEYADPNIGGALGLHGEFMMLDGFARQQFVMYDRENRTFGSRTWSETGHDLDFIFERDGVAYGVEVKNTLGYIEWAALALPKDDMNAGPPQLSAALMRQYRSVRRPLYGDRRRV